MAFFRYLIAILLLVQLGVSQAQTVQRNTLLWRITPPGKAASYIFGTIHLQDKSLFQFSDSVWQALENTKCFAMELDPLALKDSLRNWMDRKDSTKLLRNLMQPEKLASLKPLLEDKFKLPVDKISLAHLYIRYAKFFFDWEARKEKRTFVDLFLYSLAEQQGDVLTGIEDVADQLNLADELKEIEDQYQAGRATVSADSLLAALKSTYRLQQLDSLVKIVARYDDQPSIDRMQKRNQKMVIRMDSIAELRSTFFAIGAAHLVGKGNVLERLQKLGFLVEPVFCDTKQGPEAFQRKYLFAAWKQVTDPSNIATVRMPGNADTAMLDNLILIQQYMATPFSTRFGLGVIPYQGRSVEQLQQLLLQPKLKRNYEVTATAFMPGSYKGAIELNGHLGKVSFFRYILVPDEKHLVVLVISGTKDYNVTDAAAREFIGSLQLGNQAANIDLTSWNKHIDRRNAFSIELPGKPTVTKTKDQNEQPLVHYDANGVGSGIYYSVRVSAIKPGNYNENDSLAVSFDTSSLAATVKPTQFTSTHLSFQGMPACKFSYLSTNQDGNYKVHGLKVKRGGRYYLLFAISSSVNTDMVEVKRFFNSFQLLPPDVSNWQMQAVADESMVCIAPDLFSEIGIADSTQNRRYRDFRSVDPNTAASYSVYYNQINPYYWSDDDSSYFLVQAKQYMNTGDTMVRFVYGGKGNNWGELYAQTPLSDNTTRIKVMINGDYEYVLHAYYHSELKNSEQIRRFFEDAIFTKPRPVTIFTRKTDTIFNLLATGDSASLVPVAPIIEKVPFDSSDLPRLYQAALKKYPVVSDDKEYNINSSLIQVLNEVADTTVISFVASNYTMANRNKLGVDAFDLLALLARDGSLSSYQLMKKLLITDKPQKGNPYPWQYLLNDSLLHAAEFFPTAGALYGDTLVGGVLAYEAVHLVENNYDSLKTVQVNDSLLYQLANYHMDCFKKDSAYEATFASGVVRLLGLHNTAKGNKLLRSYGEYAPQWLRLVIAQVLLTNAQAIPFKWITRFANDHLYRTEIYASLLKAGKANLMPPQHASQPAMAAAYLYNYMANDYNMDSVSWTLITSKMATVQGTLHRFYLYKVTLEGSSYLFVVGGFSINNKELLIDDYFRYERLLTKQEFDRNNVLQQFQSYINLLNE